MFNECLPTAGEQAPHQQHSPTKSHGYGGYGQHHTHRSVTHGGHEFSRDRHRDDPDNLARIKLVSPSLQDKKALFHILNGRNNVIKFLGSTKSF